MRLSRLMRFKSLYSYVLQVILINNNNKFNDLLIIGVYSLLLFYITILIGGLVIYTNKALVIVHKESSSFSFN